MERARPSCTSILDGLDGETPHVTQRVNFAVVAKSPIEQIMNFAESRVDPRLLFPEEGYDRLRKIRARYDPGGMFVANHSIPHAD